MSTFINSYHRHAFAPYDTIPSKPSELRSKDLSSKKSNTEQSPITPFHFARLSVDIQYLVASFFDLSSLAMFSLTCKAANKMVSNEIIWKSIAKKIQCPIVNSPTPVYRQVLRFIATIQKEASNIVGLSEDMIKISKPSISQLNLIQNWLKARKTVGDWINLTNTINAETRDNLNLEPPDNNLNYLSLKERIDKAAEFPCWLDKNQNLLRARDTILVWLRILGQNEDLPDFHFADLNDEETVINESLKFNRWYAENIHKFAKNTLMLGRACLTSLPTQLFVQNLKRLDLSSNLLESLPSDFGQLNQLKYLDLSNNKLSSLPETFFSSLSKLEWLTLGDNQLTSLSDEICKLSDLRSFNLFNNKLSSLPEGLYNLTKLEGLSLRENKFTFLSKKICNLSDLRSFDLTNNQLSSLPEELYELTKLTTLILTGNELTSLSKKICNLTELQEMSLCNNRLSSLPKELSKCRQLEKLHLQNNELRSLPEEIDDLPDLNTIELKGNLNTSLQSQWYKRKWPKNPSPGATPTPVHSNMVYIALPIGSAALTAYLYSDQIIDILAYAVDNLRVYLPNLW